MASSPPELLLHLVGPAHVQADGQIVRLRHKGLAILCVLALDGSVRRERLADLLWESPRAMENLRVELHRLRQAFRPFGLEPFGASTDPLRLDDRIVVSTASATGTPMEGLDDLAPEFQAWLEYKRSTWAPQGNGTARQSLVQELAGVVVPGFVLVLQGSPGSGRADVARSLARRLALPFVEGVDAVPDVACLRYVDPEACDASSTARRIIQDRTNVWVIGRSTFGEDPSLLLRLRSALPPERLRFVRLAPLTWDEARSVIPDDVGFDEAASIYLASAGNPGYLAELVGLRVKRPLTPPLPIPQRLRAAYELEARRLSKSARQALERLSLIEGAISARQLDVFGAAPHLEELERCGWLVVEDGAWKFADAAAARALRGEIHEGERRRLKRVIDDDAETELTSLAGESRPPGMPRAAGRRSRIAPDGNGQHDGPVQPAIVPVGRGDEVWLDDARVEGAAARLAGDAVTWVNPDARDHAGEIVWSLPETPVLLHLSGRVVRGRSYGEPVLTGLPRHLLRLSLVGSGANDLLLSFDGPNARRTRGQSTVALHPTFDLWFLIERGRMVRLSGTPHAMVVEFAVRAYRPIDPAPDADEAVNAIAWTRVVKAPGRA